MDTITDTLSNLYIEMKCNGYSELLEDVFLDDEDIIKFALRYLQSNMEDAFELFVDDGDEV